MNEQSGTPKMPQTIADLTPDPENPRKHTERNIGHLVDSLHAVGAARSIVIDEDGTILAGNATIDAAGQAGIEKVRVIDADGDEIIAVRRKGLTPEQKKQLAYYDNRVAELAGWDAEQIIHDMQAGVDLTVMFFEAELAKIVGEVLYDLGAIPEAGSAVESGVLIICPHCGHRWENE